jgi:cysteine desulfurase family protein (TIGR01976 family)
VHAVDVDLDAAEVRAAGGVVWRRRNGDVEVAVIHRPRYDDWSLPKGKLDPGEDWEAAAAREVWEEIGVRAQLASELPATAYHDRKGRHKVVRYWLMEADEDAPFAPNDEVDVLRWLPGEEAASTLTYPHDIALVAAALARLHGLNRERFPGLAGGWARLDGPAGTQMVDAAIEATAAFARSGDNANHGGTFAAARATDALVARARAQVSALLGANPTGIAFGASMTALTMAFAAAVGRTLRPGDEIVCTRLDHDANVRPWLIAAERAGASVRFAEPEPGTLALPAAAVEAVVGPHTRWVAVTAASNAVGTVPDLPGIVGAAHAAGARVYVDAVHATPHRRIDVGALGCDALVCSAYKWFGPPVGIRAAAPALLAELPVDKLRPSPDMVPDRWELGTLPFEALAGVAAAADYVAGLDFELVRSHEDALQATALDGLAALPGVTLHGGASDRAPTLMFSVAGHTPLQVAEALAAREVAVWHGNYYAWELERLLGLAPDGAVRAGFVHYNSVADAERLVAGVRALVE